MLKRDGHVHSPFCPHGSNDQFRYYIEELCKKGFDSVSFTEHAPLPPSFIDPTPKQDSAIPMSALEDYLGILKRLKEEYTGQIDILIGLEVDYIRAFEHEIKTFLDTYGSFLDDSILSVHFLPADSSHICLDYDEDAFQNLIDCHGSIEQVYLTYFQEIFSSIVSPLGTYKPKRIGHITLVKKFVQLYPYSMSEPVRRLASSCLDEAAKRGLELDFNTAGLRKPYAGDIYLEEWMIEEAAKKNIPLVYGSDAHQAKDAGFGYEHFERRFG
ncbi:MULTISPECIES: histidinol-phosphatase HisJ [Bacillus]|uniref:histidinol-phosphatase HisJ n=1 Tax=Bacillus TaxID=1386 RepID=UPI0003FA22ED|nr:MULTISPECIES: histidinol-phosphatase HisJ [Bacillus]QHZ48062.1 histidinol-phosphatase HisJ [Bacillus sp. NSP9.1]WFA04140.1 histidinol-phosphatase HisJ [Bacillus sp. HSf4]